ncbi:hypothetical protein [Streptomyces hayashii]|uniref:hypothetical protein n=1 Tax=Streptomyces hayashii TaxID=2839966 RepID=UPI00403C020A
MSAARMAMMKWLGPWEPSPEVVGLLPEMHLLIRGAVLAWSVGHQDGPLRSPRGRRLAAALAVSDTLYCGLLATGRLEGSRGQAVRTVVDALATAASVAVYPDSGKYAGIAAALLPTVGSALEATYLRGPRSGVGALATPTAVATVVRRATGRPTSVADLCSGWCGRFRRPSGRLTSPSPATVQPSTARRVTGADFPAEGLHNPLPHRQLAPDGR